MFLHEAVNGLSPDIVLAAPTSGTEGERCMSCPSAKNPAGKETVAGMPAVYAVSAKKAKPTTEEKVQWRMLSVLVELDRRCAEGDVAGFVETLMLGRSRVGGEPCGVSGAQPKSWGVMDGEGWALRRSRMESVVKMLREAYEAGDDEDFILILRQGDGLVSAPVARVATTIPAGGGDGTASAVEVNNKGVASICRKMTASAPPRGEGRETSQPVADGVPAWDLHLTYSNPVAATNFNEIHAPSNEDLSLSDNDLGSNPSEMDATILCHYSDADSASKAAVCHTDPSTITPSDAAPCSATITTPIAPLRSVTTPTANTPDPAVSTTPAPAQAPHPTPVMAEGLAVATLRARADSKENRRKLREAVQQLGWALAHCGALSDKEDAIKMEAYAGFAPLMLVNRGEEGRIVWRYNLRSLVCLVWMLDKSGLFVASSAPWKVARGCFVWQDAAGHLHELNERQMATQAARMRCCPKPHADVATVAEKVC